MLLALAADVLADQIGEAAFGVFAEVGVVGGFLADDVVSAAIAGVEPLRGGYSQSTCAIKADAGAHLDEGSALRETGGFFVLDANQGYPLIIPGDMDGAHGDGVARAGLSDGVPLAGGYGSQAKDQNRRQYNGNEDKEGFFQSRAYPSVRTHFGPKGRFCQSLGKGAWYGGGAGEPFGYQGLTLEIPHFSRIERARNGAPALGWGAKSPCLSPFDSLV